MTINVAYTPLGEGGIRLCGIMQIFSTVPGVVFFFFFLFAWINVYSESMNLIYIYRVRLGWIDGGGIYCFEIIENEFS